MPKFSKKSFSLLVLFISAFTIGVVVVFVNFGQQTQLIQDASSFKNFPIQEKENTPDTYTLVCKINSVSNDYFQLKSSQFTLDIYKSAFCDFLDISGNPERVLVPLAVNNQDAKYSFIATQGTFDGLFRENAFDNALKNFPIKSDVSVIISIKPDVALDAEHVFSGFIGDFYKNNEDGFSDFLKSGNVSRMPKYRNLPLLIPLDVQVIHY